MREPSPKPGAIPILLSCWLRGIPRNALQRPIPNFGAVASCKNFVLSTSLSLNLLIFQRLCVTLSPPGGWMSAPARCQARARVPGGVRGCAASSRGRARLHACVDLCVWWHLCLNRFPGGALAPAAQPERRMLAGGTSAAERCHQHEQTRVGRSVRFAALTWLCKERPTRTGSRELRARSVRRAGTGRVK